MALSGPAPPCPSPPSPIFTNRAVYTMIGYGPNYYPLVMDPKWLALWMALVGLLPPAPAPPVTSNI